MHVGGLLPRKMCEGCASKLPSYGLPAERRKRWCSACAHAHHGAVNLNTRHPRPAQAAAARPPRKKRGVDTTTAGNAAATVGPGTHAAGRQSSITSIVVPQQQQDLAPVFEVAPGWHRMEVVRSEAVPDLVSDNGERQ